MGIECEFLLAWPENHCGWGAGGMSSGSKQSRRASLLLAEQECRDPIFTTVALLRRDQVRLFLINWLHLGRGKKPGLEQKASEVCENGKNGGRVTKSLMAQ